jgi:hypothetical protein
MAITLDTASLTRNGYSTGDDLREEDIAAAEQGVQAS